MRLNHKEACTRMAHASAVLTELLRWSVRIKQFPSYFTGRSDFTAICVNVQGRSPEVCLYPSRYGFLSMKRGDLIQNGTSASV
jgi:hypothetical protein